MRQASAQSRQAAAHFWQWSCLCLPHSAPHAWQTSAQTRHNCPANCESRLIHAALVQQMSAQSRSKRIHSAIIATSFSLRHAFAQCSHACAQAMHASMQLCIAVLSTEVLQVRGLRMDVQCRYHPPPSNDSLFCNCSVSAGFCIFPFSLRSVTTGGEVNDCGC